MDTAAGAYPLDDDDELELLDPPPLPDEELELLERLLELLEPVEDELELEDDELDGADDDELDDDVLEVLGAGFVELELLGAVELEDEEPVGDVGLLLSQAIEPASPKVIAPPLSRRRKSRRSASAFCASFSSILRSFWWSMVP